MAPTQAASRLLKFDYLVLGGGSGGIASARRAAAHGAKVAVVERGRLGGTCVNVGCVPKKVMFNAAVQCERLHDMQDYGFGAGAAAAAAAAGFDWRYVKEKRDAYVHRLNGIYASNLDKSGVEVITGSAKFISERTVRVNDDTDIEAKHILVAVGGRPTIPFKINGNNFGITSDGFFDLTELPKRTVIVGVGYIGVELAGILNSLGSEVHLISRSNKLLRSFDPMLQAGVRDALTSSGVTIHWQDTVTNINKNEQLTVSLKSGQELTQVDSLIWAMGRTPNTDWLQAAAANIKMDEAGHIIVDEFQNSSTKGVYAVGDVGGRALLTPVAIAAGRRLADRLFGGKSLAKLDYRFIPSVIFSHPPCGTCGFTQKEAEEHHGASNLKIYESDFLPMYFSMTERKQRFKAKLICLLPEERVIGLHIFGEAADEILQGFSVAMKMGATKRDFDDTVAIHPTTAEELVTMT